MCRLLGYVAESPTSVVGVLGEEAFGRFTALATVHGDGWGMAWCAEDGTVQHVGVADSASADPTYDALARTALGRAGILHLRWASEGIATAPENTHPFLEADTVAGTIAFAHNGHIEPIERFDELLAAGSREKLRGSTDSERYFRVLLECIEKEQDVEAGVARGLGVMVQAFPTSSLNALLLTRDVLVAVHINSAAVSPQKRLRALFEHEDDIPARHTTEYFAMDHRLLPDAVHVISSGLDETGWAPVTPDTATVVDLSTRELRSLPLRS